MNTAGKSEAGKDRFGLFAILESRRVVLPLKGVECNFSVRGGVAEVCMSQIFRQENPKPLDCEYLFPLPADASVYFCEADVNGRIIRAEIKKLEEARQIAAERKAEGFRTALVEAVRDNLFVLSLGNVQPDDLIIMRLKYFQPLRSQDEARSLEIPLCPGIRYIPGNPLLRSNRGKGFIDDTDQVPDASRLSPVRIDASHPDAAYIEVTGRLDAKYANRHSLVSPSHAIEVEGSTEELCVSLAKKGEVPDRAFVLRWNESIAETVAPRAWTQEKGNEIYALLEVRAPKEAPVQETALDFYFLVDRSGSMKGAKWDKAIEALQSCVAVLGRNDRAMVTLFETNHQDFAEQPLPARELLRDPKFQKLQELGTAGGTELLPALRHVLEIAEKHSAGRERNLILITDAQIGNDAVILLLMERAPDMAVHCFGIDIALNDALLLALSRQQGGTFHSLNPNDDIREIVTRLAKTLRQPVLLDLQLSKGWERADAKFRDLYAGQILYLSARAKGEMPLSLTARTPSNETVQFNFQRQLLLEESPFLQWHKTRIHRLLAGGLDRHACELSIASNLLCRLTAFVAWDDSEKVVVSRHELVQPDLEPRVCFSRMAGGPGPMGLVNETGLEAKAESRRSFLESPKREWRRSGAINIDAMPLKYRVGVEVESLHSDCQSLGGNDWQPFYQMIADWSAQAADDQIAQWIDALKQLVEELCACRVLKMNLEKAESSDASERVLILSECLPAFRYLQQKWKIDAGEFKDVEKLLRQLEGVEAAASAEQLALVAKDLNRLAVAMLKSFANGLQTKK
ncbi:MAG: hypothetical protein JWR26_3418 [Pedosphaera sp.]|nr:hypothetical protein [Pedosphaera sp.]